MGCVFGLCVCVVCMTCVYGLCVWLVCLGCVFGLCVCVVCMGCVWVVCMGCVYGLCVWIVPVHDLSKLRSLYMGQKIPVHELSNPCTYICTSDRGNYMSALMTKIGSVIP